MGSPCGQRLTRSAAAWSPWPLGPELVSTCGGARAINPKESRTRDSLSRHYYNGRMRTRLLVSVAAVSLVVAGAAAYHVSGLRRGASILTADLHRHAWPRPSGELRLRRAPGRRWMQLASRGLRFRSTRVSRPVRGRRELGDGMIEAGGEEMKVFAERDPAALPWADLGGVEVVSSRRASSRTARARRSTSTPAHEGGHLRHPAKDAGRDGRPRRQRAETTSREHRRCVSNASCTTNCLAPLAKVLNDAFGDRARAS